GEQLEGRGEIGLDERVLHDEALAVPFVHGARFGRVPQDEVEDGVQVRLAVVQLDTVSRQVDRRLEEVAPGKCPEGAVRVLESQGSAGDSAGSGPDVEDL